MVPSGLYVLLAGLSVVIGAAKYRNLYLSKLENETKFTIRYDGGNVLLLPGDLWTGTADAFSTTRIIRNSENELCRRWKG